MESRVTTPRAGPPGQGHREGHWPVGKLHHLPDTQWKCIPDAHRCQGPSCGDGGAGRSRIQLSRETGETGEEPRHRTWGSAPELLVLFFSQGRAEAAGRLLPKAHRPYTQTESTRWLQRACVHGRCGGQGPQGHASTQWGLRPHTAHTRVRAHTVYINIYIAQVYMLFTVYISINIKHRYLYVYNRCALGAWGARISGVTGPMRLLRRENPWLGTGRRGLGRCATENPGLPRTGKGPGLQVPPRPCGHLHSGTSEQFTHFGC